MSKHSLIMSRPVRIDDDELRESLRATFLELGPAASTQELARRAGVSEGTLFRRFGTKDRLFAAAMQLPEVDDCAWFVGMLTRAEQVPLEVHLEELALGLIAFLGELMPRIEVISSNGKLAPEELRKCLGEGDSCGPRRMRTRFVRYFARQMELGRIRSADAGALSSFFIGAVVHDFHLRHHFPDRDTVDDRTYARTIARSFVELAGVPDSVARPKKSGAKSRSLEG